MEIASIVASFFCWLIEIASLKAFVRYRKRLELDAVKL